MGVFFVVLVQAKEILKKQHLNRFTTVHFKLMKFAILSDRETMNSLDLAFRIPCVTLLDSLDPFYIDVGYKKPYIFKIKSCTVQMDDLPYLCKFAKSVIPE